MTLNHTVIRGGLPVKFPSYLQDTQHCGHSSAVWPLSYITDEHGDTQYKKKGKKALNDDALRRLDCCITCCEDKTQAAAPRASSIKDISDRYLWLEACGGEPRSAEGRLQAPQERWQQDNSILMIWCWITTIMALLAQGAKYVSILSLKMLTGEGTDNKQMIWLFGAFILQF